MTDEATVRGQPPDEFRDILQRLKQEGCAILTTGKVPSHVSAKATRKQLGYPEEDRIRILGLTGATNQDISAHLPEGCHPDDSQVHVIESRMSRDTMVATQPMENGVGPLSPEDCLEDIQDQIVEIIQQYELQEPRLEGGQLRLVVYSLKRLVDEYGHKRVFEFVEETASLVRRVSGMAHYHLPVPSDHELVEIFTESGHFDARVELLHIDGWDLQRWHLDDIDDLHWLKL